MNSPEVQKRPDRDVVVAFTKIFSQGLDSKLSPTLAEVVLRYCCFNTRYNLIGSKLALYVNRKIYLIHGYNLKVAKVQKYPWSYEFKDLLVRYVEIEYEALYRKTETKIKTEEDIVKKRVFCLLQIIFYDIYEPQINNMHQICGNAIMNIFDAVDKKYKRENNFITSIIENLISKLNLTETINELKGKSLPCPLDKSLRNERIWNLYKTLTNMKDNSNNYDRDCESDEKYSDESDDNSERSLAINENDENEIYESETEIQIKTEENIEELPIDFSNSNLKDGDLIVLDDDDNSDELKRKISNNIICIDSDDDNDDNTTNSEVPLTFKGRIDCLEIKFDSINSNNIVNVQCKNNNEEEEEVVIIEGETVDSSISSIDKNTESIGNLQSTVETSTNRNEEELQEFNTNNYEKSPSFQQIDVNNFNNSQVELQVKEIEECLTFNSEIDERQEKDVVERENEIVEICSNTEEYKVSKENELLLPIKSTAIVNNCIDSSDDKGNVQEEEEEEETSNVNVFEIKLAQAQNKIEDVNKENYKPQNLIEKVDNSCIEHITTTTTTTTTDESNTIETNVILDSSSSVLMVDEVANELQVAIEKSYDQNNENCCNNVENLDQLQPSDDIKDNNNLHALNQGQNSSVVDDDNNGIIKPSVVTTDEINESNEEEIEDCNNLLIDENVNNNETILTNDMPILEDNINITYGNEVDEKIINEEKICEDSKLIDQIDTKSQSELLVAVTNKVLNNSNETLDSSINENHSVNSSDDTNNITDSSEIDMEIEMFDDVTVQHCCEVTTVNSDKIVDNCNLPIDLQTYPDDCTQKFDAVDDDNNIEIDETCNKEQQLINNKSVILNESNELLQIENEQKYTESCYNKNIETNSPKYEDIVNLKASVDNLLSVVIDEKSSIQQNNLQNQNQNTNKQRQQQQQSCLKKTTTTVDIFDEKFCKDTIKTDNEIVEESCDEADINKLHTNSLNEVEIIEETVSLEISCLNKNISNNNGIKKIMDIVENTELSSSSMRECHKLHEKSFEFNNSLISCKEDLQKSCINFIQQEIHLEQILNEKTKLQVVKELNNELISSSVAVVEVPSNIENIYKEPVLENNLFKSIVCDNNLHTDNNNYQSSDIELSYNMDNNTVYIETDKELNENTEKDEVVLTMENKSLEENENEEEEEEEEEELKKKKRTRRRKKRIVSDNKLYTDNNYQSSDIELSYIETNMELEESTEKDEVVLTMENKSLEEEEEEEEEMKKKMRRRRRRKNRIVSDNNYQSSDIELSYTDNNTVYIETDKKLNKSTENDVENKSLEENENEEGGEEEEEEEKEKIKMQKKKKSKRKKRIICHSKLHANSYQFSNIELSDNMNKTVYVETNKQLNESTEKFDLLTMENNKSLKENENNLKIIVDEISIPQSNELIIKSLNLDVSSESLISDEENCLNISSESSLKETGNSLTSQTAAAAAAAATIVNNESENVSINCKNTITSTTTATLVRKYNMQPEYYNPLDDLAVVASKQKTLPVQSSNIQDNSNGSNGSLYNSMILPEFRSNVSTSSEDEIISNESCDHFNNIFDEDTIDEHLIFFNTIKEAEYFKELTLNLINSENGKFTEEEINMKLNETENDDDNNIEMNKTDFSVEGILQIKTKAYYKSNDNKRVHEESNSIKLYDEHNKKQFLENTIEKIKTNKIETNNEENKTQNNDSNKIETEDRKELKSRVRSGNSKNKPRKNQKNLHPLSVDNFVTNSNEFDDSININVNSIEVNEESEATTTTIASSTTIAATTAAAVATTTTAASAAATIFPQDDVNFLNDFQKESQTEETILNEEKESSPKLIIDDTIENENISNELQEQNELETTKLSIIDSSNKLKCPPTILNKRKSIEEDINNSPIKKMKLCETNNTEIQTTDQSHGLTSFNETTENSYHPIDCNITDEKREEVTETDDWAVPNLNFINDFATVIEKDSNTEQNTDESGSVGGPFIIGTQKEKPFLKPVMGFVEANLDYPLPDTTFDDLDFDFNLDTQPNQSKIDDNTLEDCVSKEIKQELIDGEVDPYKNRMKPYYTSSFSLRETQKLDINQMDIIEEPDKQTNDNDVYGSHNEISRTNNEKVITEPIPQLLPTTTERDCNNTDYEDHEGNLSTVPRTIMNIPHHSTTNNTPLSTTSCNYGPVRTKSRPQRKLPTTKRSSESLTNQSTKVDNTNQFCRYPNNSRQNINNTKSGEMLWNEFEFLQSTTTPKIIHNNKRKSIDESSGINNSTFMGGSTYSNINKNLIADNLPPFVREMNESLTNNNQQNLEVGKKDRLKVAFQSFGSVKQTRSKTLSPRITTAVPTSSRGKSSNYLSDILIQNHMIPSKPLFPPLKRVPESPNEKKK